MSMIHTFGTMKGPLFRLLFLGVPFAWGIWMCYLFYQSSLGSGANGENLLVLFMSCLVMLLRSWFLLKTWFSSHYEVSKDFLVIRFGFASKKILLAQIKSIKKTSYSSAGIRYALAWNGLLIISHEGYQWFISPKNPKQFLEKLDR